MNVLDLFSGIGGFSLGLERAGFRTIAFCEIDPYCQSVLRKHWPDVPIFGDVRTLSWIDRHANDKNEHGSTINVEARQWLPEPSSIDVICGGFPCQDISVAGKGAGIEGARSGLWGEYARIIGEVRPRYVIVENVSALLGRGLGRVLGDLAALGYDAEWHCIPASAVGAPHRRDRVWIVAYSSSERRQQVAGSTYGDESQNEGRPTQDYHQPQRDGEGDGADDVANTNGGQDVADAPVPRLERWLRTSLQECADQRIAWTGGFQGWDESRWFAQSGMGRISNGTANRVDRLRALGNAVVPQIPEIIGRAIMRAAA